MKRKRRKGEDGMPMIPEEKKLFKCSRCENFLTMTKILCKKCFVCNGCHCEHHERKDP